MRHRNVVGNIPCQCDASMPVEQTSSITSLHPRFLAGNAEPTTTPVAALSQLGNVITNPRRRNTAHIGYEFYLLPRGNGISISTNYFPFLWTQIESRASRPHKLQKQNCKICKLDKSLHQPELCEKLRIIWPLQSGSSASKFRFTDSRWNNIKTRLNRHVTNLASSERQSDESCSMD